MCLQHVSNLIWWVFASDCFILHHAYNARSDKKIAYQCKWKGKSCGGDCKHHVFFRSFSCFGLPCNDWGLGCLGSSSGENQVERVVRLVVLIQQLVNMFDTLMMFEHIVCWTQSERSKPGNLDHLHSLWLHRRAPWLAGGLLCHRVNRSKPFSCWQPLKGLVAWSGLFSGSSWWRTRQTR